MKIFRYLEESDTFRGRLLSENEGLPKGCVISKAVNLPSSAGGKKTKRKYGTY